MQSIDDRYIDSTPTLNDTFSDANVFPASVTADPAAWQAECDAAFGYDERHDPSPDEEAAMFAEHLADTVQRMQPDELCAVMHDNGADKDLRVAAVTEIARRVVEWIEGRAA